MNVGELIAETLGASLQFLEAAKATVDEVENWTNTTEWERVASEREASVQPSQAAVIVICEDSSAGRSLESHLRGSGRRPSARWSATATGCSQSAALTQMSSCSVSSRPKDPDRVTSST